MGDLGIRLKTGLLFIIDLIFSLFWFPLMLVFLSPLYLYKKFVTVLASCFRPDLIPLDTKDQFMAWDLVLPRRPNVRCVYNIGCAVRVDGRIPLEMVRNRYKEMVKNVSGSADRQLSPRLEQTLELFGGYAFRRNTKKPINVNEKILETDLGNTALFTFQADWIGRGFPEESPPWEIMLLPMEEAEETYVLMKVHHSFADAYSLLHFLNLILDNDVPVPPRMKEDTNWEMFKQVIKCPRVSLLYSLEVMAASFTPLPWSGDCSTSTLYQSCTALCVSDLKRVQRKTGAFYTPISMTLFGGVLARIIAEQEMVNSKLLLKKSDTTRKKRSTFVQLSLPLANHPLSQMCNHWTSGAFRVPLWEMKASERLKMVDAEFKLYHERGLDKLMHWILFPPGSLVPTRIFVHLYEAIRKLSKLGTIFTSVVGFQDDFYSMDGHPVVSVAPLIGMLGKTPAITGLGFSYNDRYEVTMTATSQVVGSQEEMDKIVSTYMAQELELLLSELEDFKNETK